MNHYFRYAARIWSDTDQSEDSVAALVEDAISGDSLAIGLGGEAISVEMYQAAMLRPPPEVPSTPRHPDDNVIYGTLIKVLVPFDGGEWDFDELIAHPQATVHRHPQEVLTPAQAAQHADAEHITDYFFSLEEDEHDASPGVSPKASR